MRIVSILILLLSTNAIIAQSSNYKKEIEYVHQKKIDLLLEQGVKNIILYTEEKFNDNKLRSIGNDLLFWEKNGKYFKSIFIKNSFKTTKLNKKNNPIEYYLKNKEEIDKSDLYYGDYKRKFVDAIGIDDSGLDFYNFWFITKSKTICKFTHQKLLEETDENKNAEINKNSKLNKLRLLVIAKPK